LVSELTIGGSFSHMNLTRQKRYFVSRTRSPAFSKPTLVSKTRGCRGKTSAPFNYDRMQLDPEQYTVLAARIERYRKV
jgi:hypothetical protein